MSELHYIHIGREIHLQVPDVWDPLNWATLYMVGLCETSDQAHFVCEELNASLGRLSSIPQ